MESEALYKAFLESLGLPVDPETPARVVAAMKEMTSGYCQSPEQILAKTFPCRNPPVVTFEDIHFTAMCEHHCLPFVGVAKIEYQPGRGRIVGLSKMARLVDCFARRLTLQEKITNEVADSITAFLGALWVRVTLKATHGCLHCRGVRQKDMWVTTVAERGTLPQIL